MSPKIAIDLRDYELAAVMVIDLVKHSGRDKGEVREIQEIVDSTFEKTSSKLGISSDLTWKYTGDGYVCTLVRDSIPKLLEFLSHGIAGLRAGLARHDQQFRMGVDIGLLHLKENLLTRSKEHFDLPGIRAARLEQAASPSQILCTTTVYDVFSPHCPNLFGPAPRTVSTKDREIVAYEIIPADYSAIRKFFREFFYPSPPQSTIKMLRSKILVVDDEAMSRAALESLLSSALGKDYCILSASNIEEAMAIFEPGAFAVVITDLFLQGELGDVLVQQVLQRDPEVSIIVVTASCTVASEAELVDSGVVMFVPKFLGGDRLINCVKQAIQQTALRSSAPVDLLYDAPKQALYLLNKAARLFKRILAPSSSEGGVACQMVQHKAKQLVSKFIDSVQFGVELSQATDQLLKRLESLERLSNLAISAEAADVTKFLQAYFADVQRVNRNLSIIDNVAEQIGPGTLANIYSGLFALMVCELIDNAVEAMQGTGRIRVDVQHLKTRNQFHILVSDSGPGIQEDKQKTVFEEGYTTRGSGRGLGLHLISEAVTALGGQIRCRNEGGAVFEILLPERAPDEFVSAARKAVEKRGSAI
jgi:FixJ family two-component response regulator/two-component sensor histidine kinase